MESQQAPNEQDGGSGMYEKIGTNYVCRQSSSRWTPTTDQIRILKELYYNTGVRSPTADQIEMITARLRRYGKIEGKNVFYWFQNHKARERQKKRFTNTADIPIIYRNPIIRSTPGVPSPSSSCSTSSPAMLAVGQMGSYGYGSVTMEKSFGDCTISAGCGGGVSLGHNFWVGGGADHHLYSLSYPFFDQRTNTTEEDEQEEEQHEIQTLPLFPIHADNVKQLPLEVPNSCYYSGRRNSWYQYSDLHYNCNGYSYGNAYGGTATARTSLELSLNSYTGIGSSN